MKWTTLRSKYVYQTPHLAIREDEALRPDGTPTTYSVLEAKPGAYLIAQDENARICLIKQLRYTTQCARWELPGGGVEDMESALDSVVREGMEEACVKALNPIQLPGVTQSMNGVSTHVDYYFLATKITILPFVPSINEGISERAFFTLSEIKSMLEAGDVADALSITGLMRAMVYLEREHGLV